MSFWEHFSLLPTSVKQVPLSQIGISRENEEVTRDGRKTPGTVIDSPQEPRFTSVREPVTLTLIQRVMST